MNPRVIITAAGILLLATTFASHGAETSIEAANQRFAMANSAAVPDFQRHVLPLMGRLGCNTRSCHGSFQGRGDFRLSLFGYDFKMDHDALHKKDAQRVVTDNPEASKILQKPTLQIPHKGGKRMDAESWQYRLLVRWVEAGAKGAETPSQLDRLEVTPAEVVFRQPGEKVGLRVVAHWSDGTCEDVTCLSRFRTNDESIAEVDETGVISSKAKGDTHVVAFYDNGVAVSSVILPLTDKSGAAYPSTAAATKVDGLVIEKLRKLGIVPSSVCSDVEFLRRASLDVTGTLPSPDEIRTFEADRSPLKRAAKIDELLSRPAYAAWWTNKLCDFTGNSPASLQLSGLQRGDASRKWYEWIYRRVKENVPYDQLAAGIILATSRKPGQSYEDYVLQEVQYLREKDRVDYGQRESMPYFWARRTVQDPKDKALAFSYSFLGVRLECASCHKHPFDQWTQDDFQQFSLFFQSIRYANVSGPEMQDARKRLTETLNKDKANSGKLVGLLSSYFRQEVAVTNEENRDRGKGGRNAKPKAGRVITPKLLGGEKVTVAQGQDPRQPLMDWMRDEANPYFARAFVNRVWASYFGRGIIEPADDLNLANPPSNAPLLDYLAEGFVGHGFDMKWLHREIVGSQAYQRSWQTNETNALDQHNFSHALVRRLPAEVLIDAVEQATASSTTYSERLESIEDRAFGPKANAGVARGGMRGGGAYANEVFGRPSRTMNCDCSRSDSPNLLQSIYLHNDPELLSMIERGGGWLDESAQASVRARSSRDRDRPSDAVRKIESLTKQLAEADKRMTALRNQKKPGNVDRLVKQAEGYRKELESLKKRVEAEKKPRPVAKFDVEQAIQEAFLRTLSRAPTTDEAAIARQHFANSENEAKGLRDLLWALLNTKDFVTNH